MESIKRSKKVTGFKLDGTSAQTRQRHKMATGKVKPVKKPGGGRGLAKGVSGYHK